MNTVYFLVGIIILCIVIIGFLAVKQQQLIDSYGNTKKLDDAVASLNMELARKRAELEEEERCLANRRTESNELDEVLSVQKRLKVSLEDTIQQKRDVLNNDLAAMQVAYDKIARDCEKRCEEKRQEANARLVAIDEDTQLRIEDKRLAADMVIKGLETQLENERSKYLSVIETVQRLQTEEEKDLNRHIQINEICQDDIDYLLNNVVNHLSNKDVVYKLIWSEYVQKPTNEMLDYILPDRDCAGIYKITNDKDKKAYIGRSTSVRKRLSDHIKSAVGISTIADQRVHRAMREEGLWNFSFELIEACEKDQLNEREKYYINFFSTEKLGYNQKAGG